MSRYHQKANPYQQDAMSKPVCLICGEHSGEFEYKEKSVCHECIELIRSNF
jgi:hypothetical protein